MFGSIGLPELLKLGVLAGLATLFEKRGALAITGPALALRKFEVNATGSMAVIIEGRPSGLVAWVIAVTLSQFGRDAAQTFIGGILLAAVCGAFYLMQRKIAITIETSGGMVIGLAFKPSVIENVSVNLIDALRAIKRINRIVTERPAGQSPVQ